jgi:hypothetical protein
MDQFVVGWGREWVMSRAAVLRWLEQHQTKNYLCEDSRDQCLLKIASLSGCRSTRFGSAIGPLTCCPFWRNPIDSPRFTPFAPGVLGPM